MCIMYAFTRRSSHGTVSMLWDSAPSGPRAAPLFRPALAIFLKDIRDEMLGSGQGEREKGKDKM